MPFVAMKVSYLCAVCGSPIPRSASVLCKTCGETYPQDEPWLIYLKRQEFSRREKEGRLARAGISETPFSRIDPDQLDHATKVA
jgi:hypothetical protein